MPKRGELRVSPLRGGDLQWNKGDRRKAISWRGLLRWNCQQRFDGNRNRSFSVFGVERRGRPFAISGLRRDNALMNLTTAKVEEYNSKECAW